MAEGRFIDLKSQDIKQIDEILLRYVSPNNRDSARRDLVTRFELFKYQVVLGLDQPPAGGAVQPQVALELVVLEQVVLATGQPLVEEECRGGTSRPAPTDHRD